PVLADQEKEKAREADQRLNKENPERVSSAREKEVPERPFSPVAQLDKTVDSLLMTPVSKGTRMILDQVLFQRGTAEYRDEKHLATLSSLASFLLEHPKTKILLEGHTDNLGNAQLNKELSLNRASAVRKSLM